MLKIVSNQKKLLGVFLLLGLFFSRVNPAEAIIICDTTDGVNCCSTETTKGTPFGCSDFCGIDPYCVLCTGEISVCAEYYVCDPSCNTTEPSPTPTLTNCPNGSCDAGEACYSCPADCGVCPPVEYCSDGDCNNGENCATCPADCGTCATCPNGICGTGENCNSCPADCGSCPPSCNQVTATVTADNSDFPITVYIDQPYRIDWSSTFASSCTLSGDAIPKGGFTVDSQATAGTYYYDLACQNSCSAASDRATVEVVPPCGNGICAGLEDCSSCATDCGACPTAWWQVRGGNLYSAATSGEAIVSDVADPVSCIEPSCVPGLSILDQADTADSDGFPVTAGGGVDANGQMITYRDPDVSAIGAKTTRLYENYTYFYSLYSLGVAPVDDFIGSATDALKPTYLGKEAYFHSGDLTIQSPWHVAAGESYVIFVDGNLNIQDPLDEGELIKVDEGGFLAFIVSGDITIEDTVGHSVLTNTAGNVEGVYVADGTLTVASNGIDDKKFVGEGSFVGWTGVTIARTYDELGPNNDYYPAETFVYRPDFVKNVPEKMQRAQMIWQETN